MYPTLSTGSSSCRGWPLRSLRAAQTNMAKRHRDMNTHMQAPALAHGWMNNSMAIVTGGEHPHRHVFIIAGYCSLAPSQPAPLFEPRGSQIEYKSPTGPHSPSPAFQSKPSREPDKLSHFFDRPVLSQQYEKTKYTRTTSPAIQKKKKGERGY